MTLIAPKLRTIAICAAIAVGATFISLSPLPVAMTSGHATTSSNEMPTLAPMLERVTPAVVNISVAYRTPLQSNPLFSDPNFRRYFRFPDQSDRARMSAGSGVIVDAAKGHIITNHHVVDGGTGISVTLKDGRQYSAQLIGSDKATDIALLKVDADNLTALEVGDSGALEVGDYVVAIGNPFGLGQTVTSGIVSALGRSGLNVDGYEDFIQTDASINPGNSGGALVTLDGKLIGINTAIISPAGANVGIGFAVPSQMAKYVIEQLAAHGEVHRGRLGIGLQDLTPDIAEALQLDSTSGALIANVEPESPAAAAGFQTGDVVTAVDGRAVHGATDLRNRIGLTPAGTKVSVTLKRGDVERTIDVTISSDDGAHLALTGTRLDGAVFREPSRTEIDRAGGGGIVIQAVAPGSPAAQSGLRADDIIVAVNRSPITSIDDLHKTIADKPTVLALELIRDGQPVLLVLR